MLHHLKPLDIFCILWLGFSFMEFLLAVKQKHVLTEFYFDGIFLFMVKFIGSYVQLTARTLINDLFCNKF